MTFSEEKFAQQQHQWMQARQATPEKIAAAYRVLEAVRGGMSVFDAVRRYPIAGENGGYVSKQFLVTAYRQLVAAGEMPPDNQLLERIRMKPMRTLSGVTTVTALTKPYPCPGKCVFCPTDYRMPKSYLPDEPGAMRALQHDFDPYQQVASRIEALHAIGHPTDKIELLILGGTWSSYTLAYQEWFILRCFEAMNGTKDSPTPPEGPDQRDLRPALLAAQRANETAANRNVGLVIETRPDHVTPDELAWLRYLGVTKVQMGAQSFNDAILEVNKRGHTVQETLEAVSLLRAGGFKIVLHWMPNLLGATVDSDREDFSRMWMGHCPDEIKIYPNQLLANAELYDYWLRGDFVPYSTDDLVHLLADVKATIPRYCRVNRVIRDIPSTNVVEGNKVTSLRQDVHEEMKRRGTRCECLRCREVRKNQVTPGHLKLHDLIYQASHSEEHFLSFDTEDDHVAGFLRLSLPGEDSPATHLGDLEEAALIREVHVYGQSLHVGMEKRGAAQHAGLGMRLIHRAEQIARDAGFTRLAVISAVGTRQYYQKRGFRPGPEQLYWIKDL